MLLPARDQVSDDHQGGGGDHHLAPLLPHPLHDLSAVCGSNVQVCDLIKRKSCLKSLSNEDGINKLFFQTQTTISVRHINQVFFLWRGRVLLLR